MSKHQTGKKNGQWKGGRVLASNGYILIRVGKSHPLADVRGYAYEHRLVASKKIGRLLIEGEEVHHRNEVKDDNDPDNLEVVGSFAEHRVLHRKKDSRRRMPGEANPKTKFGCGCNQTFLRFDSNGRPRSFISGHNPQDAPVETAVVASLAKGSKHRSEIADLLGKSVRVIAVTLNKLKNKGLAYPVRRGVWSLKGNM